MGYRWISGDMYRVHIEIQTETNICIYVYIERHVDRCRWKYVCMWDIYRGSYTCRENLFLESAICICMNRGTTG